MIDKVMIEKIYKRTIRYAIDRLIVRNFALEKEKRN